MRALDGSVYSATTLRLVVGSRTSGDMNERTTDNAAEELVGAVAASLTAPGCDEECLLCFVARMLDDFGCDTTLRFVKHYRDLRAPRATRSGGAARADWGLLRLRDLP